jgi:hypothetical protein
MARSLFASLLDGSEPPSTLLVKESSERSGRLLLKAITVQCLRRFSACHLFLFDERPEVWLRGLPSEVAGRLTVHDCCTDHLGWGGGPSPAPLHEATPTSFLNEVGGASGESAVVVDSLSTLADFHSPVLVARLLHLLGRGCGLVVGLVHSDLCEWKVSDMLSDVVSTMIDLTYPPPELQLAEGCAVKVTHHRPSGKQLMSTEVVTVGAGYELTFAPAPPSASQLSLAPAPPAPDPTQNLTFDLTLSEREREERKQVALPYQHSADKKTALLQAGSGKIFYQPDEADDYDDSDPDDDLDI